VAEFALLAPTFFLLVLAIVVVGIVVTNFIQVTNVARAGARMAAICAANSSSNIPDGASPALQCTIDGLDTYMQRQLTSIPAGSVIPLIAVCPADGTCPSGASTGSLPGCSSGELVQVEMSYAQPLYLPLVSSIFETSSNGTRKLQAEAQAGCE
jgi:Flp pilus assembly protein TadG